jgi:hypothetical protein
LAAYRPQALHNGRPVDRSLRQKGVFVVWQLEHTLPLPATPTLPSLCRARLRWCSIEPSEETPPSADAHSLPVGAGGAWEVLAASAGYWPPPSSARAALGGANTPPEVCSCCGGGAVTTLTPLLPAGGEAGSCSRRDWGAGRGAPAAAAAALASTAVAAD